MSDSFLVFMLAGSPGCVLLGRAPIQGDLVVERNVVAAFLLGAVEVDQGVGRGVCQGQSWATEQENEGEGSHVSLALCYQRNARPSLSDIPRAW